MDDDDEEDLDAQEALAGIGGEDGPGGFVGRPAEARPNARAEPAPPPPPDDFGDLSDDGFELNEEEMALLEAPTGTQNGGPNGKEADKSEQTRQTDARLQAQAQTIERQQAALAEGGEEDLDALLPSADPSATGASELLPRQELQPAERALQHDEDAAEGEGEGEGPEGMDGLTQEEREELRMAMEMSLAGEEE